MMRQYELVDRVRRYNKNTDEALLNRAYVYAMRAHGTQKRASGDPYFSHPLEVAAILTDLKLDDATIVAAVLHDTIEDTEATREEIDQIFGHDIATLVDGLTKIKKLDLVSKKAAQAQNLRKLLLAISEDVRVLLVKLADRLHNMRTLHYVPQEKRTRIAEETLDIYAPLAGRMGMQDMREELEDLAFRHLMPDAHAMVSRRLESLRERNGKLIGTVEQDLAERFGKYGLKASVKGREKRAYSIWTKMERKSVAFEQMSDILGFRVVVESVDHCYHALGIIHTRWAMVPGRFKDYISTPKQNDYRSIHTTVIGPGRQRVELQIRTQLMDEIDEFGIAAHATYKERSVTGSGAHGISPATAGESSAYLWLRKTLDMLAEGDSPEEFLEHTKLELFHDQVFCFTPKGQLIALPRGATPIDFAYAVHTSVGNTAVGCRVNGRSAPILSELHNGDEVEIIGSEGQSPPSAWETVVVTGKARAAIRRATRSAVRRQYAGLGRQMVVRAFAQAGKAYDDTRLKTALPRLARLTIDDVLSAVGRGEMFAGNVVKAVYPDYRIDQPVPPSANNDPGWFGLGRVEHLKFKVPDRKVADADGAPESDDVAIPIRGLDGELPVHFAPNGGAVPGDRIIGILTPGEGITIYPIQSPALTAFDDEPDRWLDVRWDIDESQKSRFPAQIMVSVSNEPGSFADIAKVIGDANANIDGMSVTSSSPDFREIVFDVEVWNLKQLNTIIGELKAKQIVNHVERVNG